VSRVSLASIASARASRASSLYLAPLVIFQLCEEKESSPTRLNAKTRKSAGWGRQERGEASPAWVKSNTKCPSEGGVSGKKIGSPGRDREAFFFRRWRPRRRALSPNAAFRSSLLYQAFAVQGTADFRGIEIREVADLEVWNLPPGLQGSEGPQAGPARRIRPNELHTPRRTDQSRAGRLTRHNVRCTHRGACSPAMRYFAIGRLSEKYFPTFGAGEGTGTYRC